MAKCWDLEVNKVIRHYHGYLSGTYTLSLHLTLVIVTTDRDASARVWDIRTKAQTHVLTEHTVTVADVTYQESDQQVITGSVDTVERLWDLATGKMMTARMHYKSVRARPTEYSFANASAGGNDFKK